MSRKKVQRLGEIIVMGVLIKHFFKLKEVADAFASGVYLGGHDYHVISVEKQDGPEGWNVILEDRREVRC